MSEQNYQDPYATQQPQSQPSAQQWNNAPAQGMQPAYNDPGYTGVATQEHPKAQTVFILGIVGIFVGICAFIAWYMGGQAKKEIAGGAPYKFEGNLKTGYMLGKIFSIIYIVVTVLYIILMIVGLGAAMSQSH